MTRQSECKELRFVEKLGSDSFEGFVFDSEKEFRWPQLNEDGIILIVYEGATATNP